MIFCLDVEEVDATVLEPLLYLLKNSPDTEVQRAASAALGNLAVNLANKRLIVRLGGLEPLIRHMSSPNVEVQCNAVGCLTNLATHEENKTAIARSSALGPLTQVAKRSSDVRVQRNATGALLNMTHSEEHRRELVEAGVIPVLVGLLRSADVDVVYYCTTALSNLAVDTVNRRKLANEQRLVPELIDLIGSSSIKIQCQAALALRNLASDDSYQLLIAKHSQGLPRLLYLLAPQNVPGSTTNPGVTGTASPSTHPQLTLAAVACLRNLSIHPANESRIIEAGFLGPLIALLSHEMEEIQCHAISTLRNLAAGTSTVDEESEDFVKNQSKKDHKAMLVASGALETIQRLMEQSIQRTPGYRELSWPVMSEMTACLAVLALSDQLKPRLLQSGIIRTLLPLTQQQTPTDVQGNAAAALGNLATKAPDMTPFLKDWDPICSYLERFLEPIPISGTHYHEMDEASGTFQHIAIWTLLQFCEQGDKIRKKIQERPQLTRLVQNVAAVTNDEEVLQLAQRVLTALGLPVPVNKVVGQSYQSAQ